MAQTRCALCVTSIGSAILHCTPCNRLRHSRSQNATPGGVSVVVGVDKGRVATWVGDAAGGISVAETSGIVVAVVVGVVVGVGSIVDGDVSVSSGVARVIDAGVALSMFACPYLSTPPAANAAMDSIATAMLITADHRTVSIVSAESSR